jgi:hypothetical protein
MAISKVHPGTKVHSQNFQNSKKMEKNCELLDCTGSPSGAGSCDNNVSTTYVWTAYILEI